MLKQIHKYNAVMMEYKLLRMFVLVTGSSYGFVDVMNR